jgi:hypothetical protein
MGLQRVGDDVMVVDWSPSFGGSGGGGGDAVDPITRGPTSSSLALDFGARVPMGCPWSSTWILAVKQSLGHGDDIGIRKISNVPSSSSSVCPSPPSPVLMMETMGSFVMQPGWGMDPNHGWCTTFPIALSKSCLGLRAPSTNRPINLGREMVAAPKP